MIRSLTIAIFLMAGCLKPLLAQDHREEAEAFMSQLVQTYFARGNSLHWLHRDSLVVIGPGRVFIHRQAPHHIGDTILPGALLQAWVRPLQGGARPEKVFAIPYTAFTQKGNSTITAVLGDASPFTAVMDELASAHSYFTEDDFLVIARSDGKPYPVIARRHKSGWKISGIFHVDPLDVYKGND